MNNVHETWKTMVAASVLGIERAGAFPPMADDLSQFGKDPMGAVAALNLYMRAGIAAEREIEPAPEPAPPVGRLPSQAAADRLHTILRERRMQVLAEWCELARQTGNV